MTREEIIKKVQEEFDKYGIWATAEPHHELDCVIDVDVDGDWKHEHLAVKDIMSKNKCLLLSEHQVEESDDDSYHSIHHYCMASA